MKEKTKLLSLSLLDYNIHHDRFLNLNMENVNELLKNVNISTLEKERLVFAIQQIRVSFSPPPLFFYYQLPLS